jgi:DNA-binding ferritin-like protein
VATGRRWRSVLVLEGVETDDRRLIDPGALAWRDLPLTLMAMTETSEGGHVGAEVAGRIDTITRNPETGEVVGEGEFDVGEFGVEVARLVEAEVLRGVSVDLAIKTFELRGENGEPLEDADPFSDEPIIFAVTEATIMGATVCPFPAFADANIVLVAGADNSVARVEFGTIELVSEGTETLQVEAAEEGLAEGALGAALRVLIADTQSMAATVRGYVWNAQGDGAAGLFREMSADLGDGAASLSAQAVAVGARVPVGVDEIGQLRTIEDGGDAVAVFDMAATLGVQNEKVLAALNAAWLIALEAEDAGTAAALSTRAQRHQSWAQRLRALTVA